MASKFLNERGALKFANAIRNLMGKVDTAQSTADAAKDVANAAIPKVDNAVNGNIPALDSNGKLTDSGTNVKAINTSISNAESNANKYADQKVSTHATDKSNPHGVTKAQVGLDQVENKSSETIRSELTKEDVTTALGYTPAETDTKYSLPVATTTSLGGVKSGTDITVDENGNVSIVDNSHNHEMSNIDGLESQLNSKANRSDLTTHTRDTNNPHGVNKNQIGLSNVENKSSETIRGELTKENVTTALGYTPPTKDTVYTLPVATASELGGVKSGTDITVDESGNVSIVDDSHNHVISNVDGLQDALDAKATVTAVQTVQTAANNAKTAADNAQKTADAAIPAVAYATANNIPVFDAAGKLVDSNTNLTAIDGKITKAVTDANTYTDKKISDLIDGAPTAMDTLGELAEAMADNEEVMDALDEAIGKKANASDLTDHTGNTSNPHGVTKAQVGLGNVENKSSATIRGELTKSDVTTALGYTPPEQDTKYTLPVATTGAIGGVKSGTGITVDSNGNVSIVDDSHNHVISNVDGLSAALDEKAKATDLTDHTGDTNNPHGVTKAQVGLSNVENKSSATIRGELTSANVTDALGYTPPRQDTVYTLPVATASALGGVKSGSDISIDANGNVTVLDDSHDHVIANIDGLESTLGNKANASDLTDHTGNTSNPHSVTKAQVGLGNVENKSSETIRSEITSKNVTDALGYTPPTQDTKYTLPVATTGAIGGVKSGTDITVDASGNVSIVDDSHNHVISNVDGLQDALNAKATTTAVEAAQTAANNAKTAANNAQTTANSAQSIANAAIPKLVGAVQGNVAILNEDGTVADGGIKLSIVDGGLRVTFDDGQ